MKSKCFLILLLLWSAWSNGQTPQKTEKRVQATQFPINPNPVFFETSSVEILSPDFCLDPPIPPTRPGLFQLDGDFENFGTSNGSSCQVETDCFMTHTTASLQDNCISTLWKVSHGTPEICISDGNHQIHLWSGDWSGNGDLEGEGIFYDCVLDRCQNYEISLKLKSSGPIKKIYFYLVDGIQHKERDANTFEPESSFYDIPSGFNNIQLIHEIDNFNTPNGNWDKVTLPIFSPLFTNMKFWIYPLDDKLNASDGPDLLFIDEVTDGLPGSAGTCEGLVNYNANPIPEITKALEIRASGSVSINIGENVEFAAGNEIALLPGITINNGADFFAHIVPCVTGNNCDILLPTSGNLRSVNNKEVAIIYPNPAQNSINIKVENPEQYEIQLLDGWNKEVPIDYEIIESGLIQISRKGLNPGIYYLRLSSPEDVIVERIILE